MKVTETAIKGVKIIEPRVFNDARGYFFESFEERVFQREVADVHFVQDNESYSEGPVVRGLHFQRGEHAQAKLVRVVEGCVLDVAVDLREGSPTFGKHVAVELSDENKRQFFIPRGFAHGFALLSPKAKFQYKCDNYYCPESEDGIAFNDPQLGIDWKTDISNAIISEKDSTRPTLQQWIESQHKTDETQSAPKRILVTGGNGQLGMSLRNLVNTTDSSFLFTDVEEMDITSADSIERVMESFKPDVVINCAAYTAVDKAESDTSLARKLNSEAAGLLAAAAKRYGAHLIQISTDYVFGQSLLNTPIEETTPTAPLGVYGMTKLEGEERVKAAGCSFTIVRTAWLYSEYGNNFLKTMLRLMSERPELKVVNDQTGTPTYAGDLARVLLQIAENPGKSSVYHFSNLGTATWFDFAREIKRLGKKTECRVLPCTTADYPTPAERPAYSVLSKAKIARDYKLDIPYWRDSLEKCIQNMEKQ